MAPQLNAKRKKGAASSSSDSYDAHLFKSPSHQNRFNDFLASKKFVGEKAFQLGANEFEHIQANIISRGWGDLTSFAKPASKQLAMEFFANAFRPAEDEDDVEEEAKYISYVRGKHVPYTPSVINQLFGLSDIEPCSYAEREASWPNIDHAEIFTTLCRPGTDWVRNQDGTPRKLMTSTLTPMAKAWATFVLHTLIPCSNVSDLNIQRANLVTAILKGEPINIGRVLATELWETAHCDSHQSYLNLPSLIGRLCERVRVKPKKTEVLIKPACPITKKWIDRHTISVIAAPGASQPVIAQMDEDPEPQEQPAPPHEQDKFQRLEEKIDQLALEQRELKRGMQFIYRAFASSQAGNAYDPNADIFAYQPPGEGSGAGGEEHD